MKKLKIVKNLVLDVDGVLTTGQFIYTSEGKYGKTFGPHDGDGIKLIKKHINIHAITADHRGFEISKKRVETDMEIPLTLVSERERLSWLKKNFNLKETIYMGDGIYDSKIFEEVFYSIAPNNAFYLAKNKADYVTNHNSAEGAVAEACFVILEKFFSIKEI